MTTMMENTRTAKQQDVVDHFMQGVKLAVMSALLLDYDGTLAPFSTDRRRARPYPGVSPLLQEIMDSGRTRVVLISGRSAPEILALLGTKSIPEVWGSHGLQRLMPDGTSEMPAIDPEVAEGLSQAVNWLAHLGFSSLAEKKPGAIAVHWRGIAEAEAARIREQVLRGWFPIAQRSLLSVLEFDGGVELRMPDLDKGDAVLTVVDEMAPDAPIAYLGDDATDERAFDALGKRGLSILVRPARRKTSAQLWLRPPEELISFLRRWAEVCTGRAATNHHDSAFIRKL